jgi:hypothetical protein
MVKKTTLILFIFLLLASVGLAASNENYLGLKVSDFALALKDFDSFAPTSGSIEFTKISGTGRYSPTISTGSGYASWLGCLTRRSWNKK